MVQWSGVKLCFIVYVLLYAGCLWDNHKKVYEQKKIIFIKFLLTSEKLSDIIKMYFYPIDNREKRC